MKVLAFISTTLLIALAVVFGLTQLDEDTSSNENVLALETAQLRIQSVQNELDSTRNELNARVQELEQIRRSLAEAKTLENGLRLQVTEAQLKNRKLQSSIEDLTANLETLQAQHRQLKSELVKMHTQAPVSSASSQ